MIDTATIVASAAIIDEEKLIGETIVNYEKKHSEKLLPAIDHLLKDVGLSIQTMDAFGVVNGPGSFTGLRIGMATAKGFAQALNKPMVTVSTLESLAVNIYYTDGIICPILDAQRSQVYTGVYQADGTQVEQIIPDTVCDINELIANLNKRSEKKYILGDGCQKYYEKIEDEVDNVYQVMPYLAMNRASSAAQIGIRKMKEGKTVDFKEASLMYIRPSSAEERFGK